ncbi:hypothetical protein MVLG_07179, partial [Microbotryum lychnidis-dioicae p1A1 Lamole]
WLRSHVPIEDIPDRTDLLSAAPTGPPPKSTLKHNFVRLGPASTPNFTSTSTSSSTSTSYSTSSSNLWSSTMPSTFTPSSTSSESRLGGNASAQVASGSSPASPTTASAKASRVA